MNASEAAIKTPRNCTMVVEIGQYCFNMHFVKTFCENVRDVRNYKKSPQSVLVVLSRISQ